MAVHIDKGEKEMLAERKPYVGVAAMRYQADIPIIAGYHELLDRRQILVLSFQTSSKTLRGEINNHPGVFPPFDKLRELLEHYSSHKEVELHIHFYSDNPREGLESELQQLADAVGDLIHGIQLNMAWPDPVI